jgi:hypothetical protein
MLTERPGARRNLKGAVLLLMRIDLSNADIETFEKYEDVALRCLRTQGGSLDLRVRSVDDGCETHLVSFPDDDAFEQYMKDSLRVAAQNLWIASRAVAAVEFVRFV